MTNDKIALRELLEKGSDATFLREMIGFAAERLTDEADLVEVYETERHLLSVACTRARDSLWVSGVTPESEFLRDVLG
jgi:superfamily I DNA/RNA helicase